MAGHGQVLQSAQDRCEKDGLHSVVPVTVSKCPGYCTAIPHILRLMPRTKKGSFLASLQSNASVSISVDPAYRTFIAQGCPRRQTGV